MYGLLKDGSDYLFEVELDDIQLSDEYEDEPLILYPTVGDSVFEFHDKYFPDAALNPIDFSDDPRHVNSRIRENFTKISEEVDELFEALEVLQDAVDDEEHVSLDHLEKLQENVLKEVCDVVYTLAGYCTAFGIDFDEAFARVHDSNMTKDGDYNGNKLLKGEAYVAPDLSDLV